MTTAIVKAAPTDLAVSLPSYDAAFEQLEAVVFRPGFRIDGETWAAWANVWLHAVASAEKEVENFRKSITQPINAELDAINGEFMPRVKRARQLKSMLADALAAYVKEQQRAKDEAMRQAAQAHLAGQHQDAQLALQVANQAQASAPAGTSMRQVWKAQVTDPAAVPREFCVPDEKRINQIARETPAGARPPAIPGVHFYLDTQTTVRTK